MEKSMNLFDAIVEACDLFNYYKMSDNKDLCNECLKCGEDLEDLLSKANITIDCAAIDGLLRKVSFYLEKNGKKVLLEERNIEI